MSDENEITNSSKDNESLNNKDEYNNIILFQNLNKQFSFLKTLLNCFIDNFPKQEQNDSKTNNIFDLLNKNNVLLHQKICLIKEQLNNNLIIPINTKINENNDFNNFSNKDNELNKDNNINNFEHLNLKKIEEFVNNYCVYIKEIGKLFIEYSENIIKDINIYNEEINKIKENNNKNIENINLDNIVENYEEQKNKEIFEESNNVTGNNNNEINEMGNNDVNGNLDVEKIENNEIFENKESITLNNKENQIKEKQQENMIKKDIQEKINEDSKENDENKDINYINIKNDIQDAQNNYENNNIPEYDKENICINEETKEQNEVKDDKNINNDNEIIPKEKEENLDKEIQIIHNDNKEDEGKEANIKEENITVNNKKEIEYHNIDNNNEKNKIEIIEEKKEIMKDDNNINLVQKNENIQKDDEDEKEKVEIDNNIDNEIINNISEEKKETNEEKEKNDLNMDINNNKENHEIINIPNCEEKIENITIGKNKENEINENKNINGNNKINEIKEINIKKEIIDNKEDIKDPDIVNKENINNKIIDKETLKKNLESIVEQVISSILNTIISEKEEIKNKNMDIKEEKEEKEKNNDNQIKIKEEKEENTNNNNNQEEKKEINLKNKDEHIESKSINEEDENEEEENIIILNKNEKISGELEDKTQFNIEENKQINNINNQINQIKETEKKEIKEEMSNKDKKENENDASDIISENAEKNIESLLGDISGEEENININKEIDEKKENEKEEGKIIQNDEDILENKENINIQKKEENKDETNDLTTLDNKENTEILKDNEIKKIEETDKTEENENKINIEEHIDEKSKDNINRNQIDKINNENIDNEQKSQNEKQNDNENNILDKDSEKQISKENNNINNEENPKDKALEKNDNNNKEKEYDFDLDEEEDIDIIIKNKKDAELNSNLIENKDNNEEKLVIPSEIKEEVIIIKNNQNLVHSNDKKEIVQENKIIKEENQKFEKEKKITHTPIIKNEPKLTLPLFPSTREKEIYIESAIKKILSQAFILDEEFKILIDILLKNNDENKKHFFSCFLNTLQKHIKKKIKTLQNFYNFKKLLNIFENICIKEERAYIFDSIIETSQYLKFNNCYLYQYFSKKIHHFQNKDFWKILIENILVNSLNERVKFIINRENQKKERGSLTERGQKKVSFWKDFFTNPFNSVINTDEEENDNLKQKEKDTVNILEIMGYSKHIRDYKKLNNKLKKELDDYANKSLNEILCKYIINMSKFGFNVDDMKILIINFCAQFGFNNELKEYYLNLIDCYQYKNGIHLKKNLILKNKNNIYNDKVLICIISNVFIFMPINERFKLIILNKRLYNNHNIKRSIFNKILREKNLSLDNRLLIWEDILQITKLKKQYNYNEIKEMTLKKISNGELQKGTRIYTNNETIDKDVSRTVFLVDKIENQKKLTNILRTLNLMIPSIGYYQGISYIAGFLLQILNFNEEKTFFYMLSLETQTDYKELFKDNLKMLNSNFRIFEKILKIGDPEICLHLNKYNIMADYFTPSWFLTIFSNFSPIFDIKNLSKFCVLVFEKFILDGWDAVFNAGYTSLTYYKKELIKTREETILNYLTTEFINKDIFKNADYDNVEKEYIKNSSFINRDLISMLNAICIFEKQKCEEEI